MAIQALPPSRPQILSKRLQLISNPSANVEQVSSRLFYTLIGVILIFGLLGLLGINILLSRDAVLIRELKLASIAINEEREAALREVSLLSSPERLAAKAVELGMVASGAPRFIELSGKNGE